MINFEIEYLENCIVSGTSCYTVAEFIVTRGHRHEDFEKKNQVESIHFFDIFVCNRV